MKSEILPVLFIWLVLLTVPDSLSAQPVEEVEEGERCAVCGMFVAKYPNWLAQIRLADGTVKSFDGVKDMMVFYLNPDRFGASVSAIQEVWVRDYYSLDFLPAHKALYVIGSDVTGPMGHEFIPFAVRRAAENFLKDHKGKSIIPFAEITDSLVQSMRHGQKMRH